MLLRCVACNGDLKEGAEVHRIPPTERVLLGEKSGVLGIYPQGETVPPENQDIIHHNYSCYEKYFSPMDNPFLYDSITKEMGEMMEKEIREEVREELASQFEDLKEMVGQKNFNFCVDCWANLEPDEPPVCLWCKRPDHVWMHQKLQGTVLCCTACNKYWDDREDELPPP